MHAGAGKGCSDRALQHAVVRSGCCALLDTRRGWGDDGGSCHLRDGSRRGLRAFGGGDDWPADPLMRGDGAWGLVSGVSFEKPIEGDTIPFAVLLLFVAVFFFGETILLLGDETLAVGNEKRLEVGEKILLGDAQVPIK